MRAFLDTEFTDFTDPALISFALVAEDGRAFYAELTDGWRLEQCSGFVRNIVLPLLDGADAMTRVEARVRLTEWLATLGSEVEVVYDAAVDGRLLAGVLAPYTAAGPALRGGVLDWPGAAMARRFMDLLEGGLAAEPRRHHALVDARALCQAVLRTEADFKSIDGPWGPEREGS